MKYNIAASIICILCVANVQYSLGFSSNRVEKSKKLSNIHTNFKEDSFSFIESFPTSDKISSSLPFETSIGGNDTPLLYKSYYDWHLVFLQEHLTNLIELKCTTETNEGDVELQTRLDFSCKENLDRPARIFNQCFQSDEFRKIRMTYYDAGPRCQVFNALWYPNYDCDLPVLGIDLLAFNGRKKKENSDSTRSEWKFLTIMDWQPILPDKEQQRDHSQLKNGSTRDRTYEHEIMEPIRSKYPNLQGEKSDRFYESDEFFSSNMMYGRYENSDILENELYPAFQEYVTAYTKLVQKESSTPERNMDIDDGRLEDIQTAISDFDTFNARRDPAKAMFAKVFGKEWAEEFVHGFLFSDSLRDDDESVAQHHDMNTLRRELKIVSDSNNKSDLGFNSKKIKNWGMMKDIKRMKAEGNVTTVSV